MSRRSIWDEPTQTAAPPALPLEASPAQTVLESLRPAPVRRSSTPREPVVTYRGIPPELHTRLKTAAEKTFGVPVGELARFCLEHALLAVAAGALPIEPQLTDGRRTLYPTWQSGAKPAVSPARQSRKPKSKAQPNIAYRGVPPEIAHQVEELAHRPGVQLPIGEVARLLLEFGLDQIESGDLKPTVYEIPVRRSFYA